MTEKTKKKLELRRRYHASSPITIQCLETAISLANSACDSMTFSYGSCELRNGFHNNISIKAENLEDLIFNIQKYWSEVSTSWASFWSEDCRIDFHCDHKKSLIELTIESSSIEECDKILSTFEEKMHLTAIEDAEKGAKIKRRFFTTTPLARWFEEFINYVTSSWTPLILFNGSYDLRDYFFGSRFEVEMLDKWTSDIRQKWSEITESYAIFSSDNCQLTLRCDHRRSMIDLEVYSSSIETSNNILLEMEKQLNLSLVLNDPYRYRKSAATYKVGDWNKIAFVEATKVVIQDLFKGQEPAVKEAFVAKILDNDLERLQGFYDIGTYLNFIKESDESAFEWSNLTLEGANGWAFGISINKKEKRLQFRSNIPPNELEKEIVKPYKEPLQLKLTKATISGSEISDTMQPKAEKWWVKYATQIIVAVIAALVGTATVLISLARSYFTEYDLIITNPVLTDSNQLFAEVDSSEVSLSWYLWPKDPLFKEKDLKAQASIIIIHKGTTVGEFTNATPPLTVQLDNGGGKYRIEVQPEKKAKPAIIVIEYNLR